jgi:hypothetical protein
MAVKPEDVVQGACFVTSTKQVRKVAEITADDRVNYMARASSGSNFGWGFTPSILPLRSEFASQVDRKVSCDGDPDYPERKGY